MNNIIKVGFLVSYDYEFLYTSIPLIYPYVDEIYLAIDYQKRTWVGNTIEVPPIFYSKIKELDTENKIQFYEDDFYDPSLNPLDNDTRERTMLSKFMGNGWLLQVDSDEYIYHFETLVSLLKNNSLLLNYASYLPISIRGRWVTLFKKTEDGYLYIDNNEPFSIATNYPHYTVSRDHHHIYAFDTNMYAIHQSWARSEEEIYKKIYNWGHRDDFDIDAYFDFWKNLSSANYQEFTNFHPLNPKMWNKLSFIKSDSIEDFIQKFEKNHPQQLKNIGTIDIIKSAIIALKNTKQLKNG